MDRQDEANSRFLQTLLKTSCTYIRVLLHHNCPENREELLQDQQQISHVFTQTGTIKNIQNQFTSNTQTTQNPSGNPQCTRKQTIPKTLLAHR